MYCIQKSYSNWIQHLYKTCYHSNLDHYVSSVLPTTTHGWSITMHCIVQQIWPSNKYGWPQPIHAWPSYHDGRPWPYNYWPWPSDVGRNWDNIWQVINNGTFMCAKLKDWEIMHEGETRKNYWQFLHHLFTHTHWNRNVVILTKFFNSFTRIHHFQKTSRTAGDKKFHQYNDISVPMPNQARANK